MSKALTSEQSVNHWDAPEFKRRLRQRRMAEKRFRLYGISAVLLGVTFVLLLFFSIAVNGVGAFWQTQIQLEVFFDPDEFGDNKIQNVNYGKLVKNSIYAQFPDVSKRKQKRELRRMVSVGADVILQRMIRNDPSLIGTTQLIWLPVDDAFDMLHKNDFGRDRSKGGANLISESQLDWFDSLVEEGKIESRFNRIYLTSGDSCEP